MHGPGLKVKLPFEDWYQFLESLLGAAVEGAFLLILATGTFHAGVAVHASVSKFGWVVNRLHAGCCLFLVVWSFAFILSSIVGDATYRLMSGNDSPSAEILRAGFEGGLEGSMANMVAQFQHEPFGFLWRSVFGASCLVGSVYVYVYPWRKQWKHERVENQREGSLSKSKPLIKVSMLGFFAFLMNSRGWYTPVIFAYLSVFFYMDDYTNGTVIKAASSISKPDVASVQPGAPNIIYLQHESLSGSIMLNTDGGVSSMPFFQEMMHNDPNMYVFEHQIGVSGNTKDAFPALMTGCLPYTMDGIEWVHEPGQSIGYDFHSKGYKTASFSSSRLDKTVQTGAWRMMYDMIAGAMDKVSFLCVMALHLVGS